MNLLHYLLTRIVNNYFKIIQHISFIFYNSKDEETFQYIYMKDS